jgi:hypothetical protein
MRLVVSLLAAVASSLMPRPVQLALRRSLGLRLSHRHHQAAVTSSEAGRQLHDHVSVDRWPAVDPFGSQSPPLGTLGRVLFSRAAPARLGGDLAASAPCVSPGLISRKKHRSESLTCCALRG